MSYEIQGSNKKKIQSFEIISNPQFLQKLKKKIDAVLILSPMEIYYYFQQK